MPPRLTPFQNELRTRNKTTLITDEEVVRKLRARDYLVVDIETDDLHATRVWVICTKEGDQRKSWSDLSPPGVQNRAGTIEEGIRSLKGRLCIMHNGLKFDMPTLHRLYPDLADCIQATQIIDTMALSKLGNPTRPRGHSLAAWGAELGVDKIEHEDWSQYTAEMEQRCLVDCDLTDMVLWRFMGKDRSIFEEMPLAVDIEHSCAWQVALAEDVGFHLDTDLCQRWLIDYTKEYDEVLRELQGLMPTRLVPTNRREPEKTLSVVNCRHALYGMLEAGVPYCPVKIEEFTGSRQQVASRFQSKYGWKPTVFTDGGEPKLDEVILAELPYPEAPLLMRLYDLEKKLGFLKSRPEAKRKTGWLDLVEDDGRIHCSIDYNRAYTHRMAASKPNLMQVSTEMRECWLPRKDWVLVGIDAASLEARMMAHYVAKFDGGKWVKELLEGDIHTANATKIGAWSRNTAKTLKH